MDEVFKALADSTRRALLDDLFEEDGQTLGALEAGLPMTRFGVMKHLKVLEEAGLVKTRRRGREKLHFLNPVPIRLVHDRWVSKYAEPWAAALSGLKKSIEEETMEKVFEIYIRTTPERLWEAINDSKTRRVILIGPDADDGSFPDVARETVETDPPRRLVERMVAEWSEEVKREGPSRVTWEIEPVGTSCRLTVIHDELKEGANDQLYGGWPMILSALKTLLETGEHLDTPASLRFAAGEAP
jgi:DNA-binding transcriptional ArsR family regulator